MMRGALVLAAAAMAAACTPKQPVTDTSLSQSVAVEVSNDLNPPDQYQISIVPQNGTRAVLGTVSPGQRMRFTYTPINASGTFVLIAQSSGGGSRPISSQRFSLVNATGLLWSLRANTLTTYEN